MPLNVSLSQVLDTHTDGRFQDVHVSVPGQIVSWTSGTATVQPTVRKPLTSADGVLVYETLPQIQNVPCFVQAAGGFICSMPYTAGDPVMLIFSEQSYAEWLATGQISSPKDIRRHGVGYPFAIPGPRPASKALSSLSSTKMVVGRDGQEELITIGAGQLDLGVTGVQFVALANLVANELSKIQKTLGTGSNSGGPVVFDTPYAPSSVAASLVKAK